MSFFSPVALTDETGCVDTAGTDAVIASLSFSNFVRHEKVKQFLATRSGDPTLPSLRYVYLYYMFKKTADYMGNALLKSAANALFPTDPHEIPSVQEVYAACCCLPIELKERLCLRIEAATRGQHNNILWETMRNGVISSSKFPRAVKQQTVASRQSLTAQLFSQYVPDTNPFVATPIAFGLRCEPIVKKLISLLVCRGRPTFENFGFLHSMDDGTFAASLDMCTNVIESETGSLVFLGNCDIYEVKCRHKYLLSLVERNPLTLAYLELYHAPSEATFISFINAIANPAVEYVQSGRVPSENDYLITQSTDWNLKVQRKRRITVSHSAADQCIKVNSQTHSVLYVFTNPSETQGQLHVKARFKLPVFVNPRHSYFYQVALQYKVVSDYVAVSQAATSLTVNAYIATAFFRRRTTGDPAPYTLAGVETIEGNSEIPILLLITPVNIPRAVLEDKLTQASCCWTACARDFFEQAPWAPVAPVDVAAPAVPAVPAVRKKDLLR